MIQGINPGCTTDCFRPFCCKTFPLCPSCPRKRTLLSGEYVNERLLFCLPHQQTVFTPRSGHGTDFPKVLRVFFFQDRNLFGEVSRFFSRMIQRFSNEAADGISRVPRRSPAPRREERRRWGGAAA
jgi:hypothetical protein